MAVDTNFVSLFENLKLEDPWLPPRPWESIPRESGGVPVASTSQSSSLNGGGGGLSDTSAVSEASLVRLAMNALQGVESSLLSIDKLCAAFCSCPADRTFHQSASLWNRSLSTSALGKILKSIGCMGCEVFLLRKFVDYFTNLYLGEKSWSNEQAKSDLLEERTNPNMREREYPPYSLVNHAFAKAVGKVLEGYISSLDTLYSSVGLRRSSKSGEAPSFSDRNVGCLTSIGHEFTLLEVYLHTKGLRTQIEALGYICNVHNVALCFSQSPFENLSTTTQFSGFPRGGNLLTYLYTKLKVADTGHSALLKILFLRSCEPYFEFIKSWIFKAKISDPYNEFIVANADKIPSSSLGDSGISVGIPSAMISEREGVTVPCFLRDFLTPLCRAGQQLQVLMKLLELCDDVGSWNRTYKDFLPYWSEMPSNSLSQASPLAFKKKDIEATVCARNNYYKYMREKLGSLLTNLDFRYQQAIPQSTIPSVYNSKRSRSQSFSGNDAPIFPSAKNRNQSLPNGEVESDSSNIMLEFPCVEESLESSEYSSFTGSEEDEEEDAEELSQKLNEFPDDTVQEQKYMSALSFYSSASFDMSLQKPSQRKMSCTIKSDSCEASERTCLPGYFTYPHDEEEDLNDTSPLEIERNLLWTLEDQYLNNQHEMSWPIGGLLKNPFCVDRRNLDDTWSHVSDYGPKESSMYSRTGGTSCCSDRSKNFLTEKAATKDQHPIGNSFTLKPWKVKYHSNFLCANPMLTKNSFVHWASKPVERFFTEYIKCVPSFDFISVKDPLKVYVNRSAVCPRQVGHEVSVSADCPESANISMSNFRDKGHNSEKVSTDKTRSPYVYSPSNVKANVSGGSGWEILLSFSGNTANFSVREQKESAALELPLDYIIEKYLLEEIQLQYTYVSKLTIKLLEEGFHLQKHLLALRRYHLMESADWADLFLFSLQHHKWYIPEAEKKISEIQGLLELSLQKSSCETDVSKDRLYVYVKEPSAMPLPDSSSGIHSFDVLGLGYRVDWPVSIILTPVALKIYAEIFSFLIQVKLAVSSLTEVWCSFKELKHFKYQKGHSELRDSEAFRFNILMRLRQQVYHFVTTLQQYVQSQLSQASWCRFLHSVEHKVKDMMDLESAHMEYLSDSLHICFLSKEMGAVADIVHSILQCALDLKSSLVGSTWNARLEEGFPCTLSHINISQVVIIKEKFDKNIKELYLCYLKSPRNLEFGLARFWEYLDYNEHYSGVMAKEVNPYALSI